MNDFSNIEEIKEFKNYMQILLFLFIINVYEGCEKTIMRLFQMLLQI